MADTLFQRSFAAGELSPGYGARADLAKYLSALRTCRNFLVRRSGGVANRPGTVYLAETKASGSARAFLQPFVFAAADASFIIECGDSYFRFFKNGAPVTVSGVTAWSGATAYVVGDLASRSGVNYYCILGHTNHQPPNATYWYALTGSIYEIPTPYSSGAFLPPTPACFTQNGLIITISHPNYAPRELRYAGATSWTLTTIVTEPWTDPPDNGAGSAGAVGTRTYSYVVTAAKAETYEETNPSDVIAIASAAEPTVDAPHELTWDPVVGAAEYYIYGDGASENGTFGLLGVATGAVSFRDTGFIPDYGVTPPVPRALFATTNNYPCANVVYQQRRIFGGTHTDREQVFCSRTGFYSNFGIRSPLQDDDAITFTIASKYLQPVIHLLGLDAGLVLLTDTGAWLAKGDEAGVLRPTAINPRQQGWFGSSFTEPAVIGEAIIYVQARGNVLRDLRFAQQIEGLGGRDLVLYSAHLFAGYTIDDIAFAAVPDSIVWCVRSDGALLGMTYIPEEDVWGWHRHDTDGTFEQVCTIPEGDEDAVYVIVKRTINGTDKRFVERFASRLVVELEDAIFMDAAKTYDGAAATLIGGLSHLRAKTVKVLADGVVPSGTFVVSSGGFITLPTAASKVQVGLPITAQLETLDLDVAGSSIRDSKKRVVSMALLLEASGRGFRVGTDITSLRQDAANEWDAAGLFTGQVELTVASHFTDHGRTFIQHTDPLPLTVLGVLPRVDVGG